MSSARRTKPLAIKNGPEGLAHVALISTGVEGYEASLATVANASAVPLERVTIAEALRALADAVEAASDDRP